MVKPYYSGHGCLLFHGDCRGVLPQVSAASFHLVLSDPPYGITSNGWDVSDPYQITSLLRPFGTVVITASEPFAAQMIVASDRFRHEWIWQKNRGSNFANTVREPMKEHEKVLVFSEPNWTYNGQRQERAESGKSRVEYNVGFKTHSENYREFSDRPKNNLPQDRCPSSVQKFNTEVGLHPTQKPVALFQYMVRTYSNENDLVLDPFAGSGTTLVAAVKEGRRAVGIELEERYCEIAAKRIEALFA